MIKPLSAGLVHYHSALLSSIAGIVGRTLPCEDRCGFEAVHVTLTSLVMILRCCTWCVSTLRTRRTDIFVDGDDCTERAFKDEFQQLLFIFCFISSTHPAVRATRKWMDQREDLWRRSICCLTTTNQQFVQSMQFTDSTFIPDSIPLYLTIAKSTKLRIWTDFPIPSAD